MYPGQQGQPPYPGQPGPQGPYPGPYPPQGPYQGAPQGPYQGGPPPQGGFPPQGAPGPYPPQQPQPFPGQQPPQFPGQQGPQPYAPQPHAPQMQVGEGRMQIDPNLTMDQRTLVIRIQKSVKVYVPGFFAGIPFTAGGLHAAVSGKVQGLVFALVGLVALALGTVFFKRTMVLREQLRRILPDAWRSPAAHLPGARKAATLAAYLNGLLALLGAVCTVWLLVMGAGWGAYGNSFGFAGLILAAAVPGSLAAAAATTIPQLLRVVPAGANVGRALYSILMVVGATMVIKGEGIMALVVGGPITLISLAAMFLLTRAAKRMRGAA